MKCLSLTHTLRAACAHRMWHGHVPTDHQHPVVILHASCRCDLWSHIIPSSHITYTLPLTTTHGFTLLRAVPVCTYQMYWPISKTSLPGQATGWKYHAFRASIRFCPYSCQYQHSCSMQYSDTQQIMLETSTKAGLGDTSFTPMPVLHFIINTYFIYQRSEQHQLLTSRIDELKNISYHGIACSTFHDHLTIAIFHHRSFTCSADAWQLPTTIQNDKKCASHTDKRLGTNIHSANIHKTYIQHCVRVRARTSRVCFM